MKHLYIFTLFYALVLNAEAKNITLSIPDKDIAIVENDVIDAEQWIKDAWKGKVEKCKERMVGAEIKRSVAENQPIPAGSDAIVDKAFARPDYKSRKQRDAEILKEK